jgi:RHS repeat-associated protein
MKKIFLVFQLILGLCFTEILAQTPTTGKNAVMEKTPREAMTTLTGATHTTVQTAIQYFDGLGKPTQVVVYKGSPDATKDILSSTTQYDALGRAYKSILPTPSDGATGAYKPTAQTLATSFYDNDANPFAETIFEASPLNRPKQQYGAGQAWRAGAGHSVGMEYLTAGTEILHFEIRASGTIEKVGTYAGNSLICNRIISERDFKTNEYKDRLGRVVAKSQELTAGNFAISLYIYDDLNRLRIVIPPEAYQAVSTMASFTESSPVFLEGMFSYVYDARGRIAEKHVPGGGTVRYVYDKNDRVVLENDDQDEANYWKMTRYDALSRPIMTGLLTGIGSNTRQTLQTAFDGVATSTYEETGTSLLGYTNRSFPTASIYTLPETNVKTVMYYDDYLWQTDTAYNFKSAYAFHTQANTKGIVTGTLIRNLETNAWYKFVNYVDYQGRIIQQFSQNHVGGIDRVDYQYRFNGEVLKMRITHKKVGVTDIVEEYIYQYDHLGRKTSYKHSLNGVIKNVGRYNFDAIGRLKQKELSPNSSIGSSQTGNWTNTGTWQGGSIPTISDQVTINTGHTVTIPNGQTVSAGTLFDKGILQNFGTLNLGNLTPNISAGTLQTIDFSYHIRGLRGINLDANNDLTNKFFSMRLDYETSGFYDGNIGKQEWKSNIDNVTRSYTYDYDGGSRIKSGLYAGNGTENYSLNSVTYDLNGNIKSLSRNGWKSSNTFGLVDNLNYTYNANSNKILKVDDASNETASFRDISGNDYAYNLDGSLISDANKGITLIEYNYLKLPRRIVKGSTVILNEYDAMGKKLKETIGSNTTDYVGNKIYKNGGLYQISHDEGRIIDGQYEYFINDHLGNLRVAFRDSSGVAKISQKQDFDPYGTELQKLSYLKSSWKQSDFKYSGKEFIEETGLNDFGWRQQDPILGRMWGIDYRAEKYYNQSPMQFALNNPVINVEADGDSVSINFVQGGGKNGRDLYQINFTGKVVDNTSSGLSPKQLSRIANQISSQFVSSFSGKDKNVEFTATANITVESSSNSLVPSDHAIRIVDDVATTIGQTDPPGGNIEGFGKPQQNYVYLEKGANYGRTGTHELGHSFGLGHIKDLSEIQKGSLVPLTTNDYPGNLMHQGQDMNSQGQPAAGMSVESFQIKEIHKMYMIPALNRGKQKK